ncbi:nucleotide sugar dehydrogenase [Sphingobacterium sp. PU5-4]|uniref:Nucleotide sugar dehydrogenase n=1 Tax=Sphingobacterium tenebrionis TaxID=3111775 RepID=A0ABU8I1V6_9SPHI
MNNKRDKIAILGLGYVGLPLALEFARKYPVVGFDINESRVEQLKSGIDETFEVDLHEESALFGYNEEGNGILFSSELSDITDANIYIVTVPTPINSFNVPNLKPLLSASKMIAERLKKGDLVIYESTVYPGCTEEDCIPVLERISKLKFNQDFFVGYSPERINPGDKVNTLVNIKKVTSGSDEETAERVDKLYASIIKAGTFKAASIQVAEAAKAIENAQRDVNISFVNELALIFDRLGIDTQDVLDAASTKFNFLPFKPGLVGGHCISVDPFYLAHKAAQLGYQPNVILSGRRVNERMANFVASKVVKLMIAKDIAIKGSRVLILGITFKENCPDIRNSKVVEIYKELEDYGVKVEVFDPWANPEQVLAEYDIDLLKNLIVIEGIKERSRNGITAQPINQVEYFNGNLIEIEVAEGTGKYDAVILTVAHQEFNEMDIRSLVKENSVVFDTKGILDRNIVDARL